MEKIIPLRKIKLADSILIFKLNQNELNNLIKIVK